jgi:hypothetical protein
MSAISFLKGQTDKSQGKVKRGLEKSAPSHYSPNHTFATKARRMLLPPPMTHFPIVASLFKVGVGVGALISYLTAWSLFGLQRIIMWEIPILGIEIVAACIAASFLFPVLAGWLGELTWARFHA